MMQRVWDWLQDLDRINGQRERDRRRRVDQGARDGYARSGEPSPVPVYLDTAVPGPPPVWLYRHTEVPGDGINLSVGIESPSNSYSLQGWCVWESEIATGDIAQCARPYWLYAADHDDVLTSNVFGMVATTATSTLHHIERIQKARMLVVIETSNALRNYHLAGWFEEDR